METRKDDSKCKKISELQRGGGKSPLRRFYYDYRDELIFGLGLSVLVIGSYMLSPLIPVQTYHAIIMPILYTMIITFCGGGAYLFWRHNEGKRMRKIIAGVMAGWTVLSLVGLAVKLGGKVPEVADGVFNLQGWEFVFGDIMAWMLMLYPTELLRPGWLTWKKALLQVAPIPLIGLIDMWVPWDLRWILALYPMFILFMLFSHVRAYRQWCEENYASMDNIDFQWVVRYLIMVFIVGCSFTYLCFDNQPTYSFTQLWLLFFLLFYSTEKIMFRPDPWERMKEEDERKEASPASPSPDNSSYAETLERWMETEKPYLNKDFRLTDLMRVLPMNRTYLSQFINAEYGCNFYQFVMKYRIDEAKRVMRESPDLKIQDVAERCGFASPVVFSRTFLRETGVTPSEWKPGDIDNS